MNLLLWLIVIATVLNGGLAGGSLEGSLVKLPARRRIGVVAYATFARGNDLGNGLWSIRSGLLAQHCLPSSRPLLLTSSSNRRRF